MMMFAWGVVFMVVVLMVIMYLGVVSEERSDCWFGMILFLIVFTLGRVSKTLF